MSWSLEPFIHSVILLQSPPSRHCIKVSPVCIKPSSHPTVANAPNVVPAGKVAYPFNGAGFPQSEKKIAKVGLSYNAYTLEINNQKTFS